MSQSRFQFTLRSFLLVIIISSVVIGLFIAIKQRRAMRETPLEWQPFTQPLLNESLEKGQSAIVVYYSHWKSRPLWRIENPAFRQLVREQNIIPIDGNAHYDNFHLDSSLNGQIHAEIERLNLPTNDSVFVAIYRPGKTPVIFYGYPDKLNENAIRALRDN